jgi:hypothetical protein
VNQYLYVGENTGAITLAEIAGTPLVSTLETGDGKVVFLGIYPNSTYSDFHLKPSFPIFWRNLIGWLGREESSGVSKNFRAGERLPSASNQTIKVKKPSGEVIEGSVILLDEAGFYEVLTNNMKVSASLLNEGESDISYKEDAEVVDVISEYNGETTEKENTTELFWIIAVFALLIVVIEWFYYKGRGSL